MKKLLKNIRDNNVLLEVVNGELKVLADHDSIDPELIADISKNKERLIKLLISNPVQQTGSGSIIPEAPAAAWYPLSFSQRRLWILSQSEQGNVGYNIPGVYIFEDDFDQAAFVRSFNSLINRHEILRTVFKENEHGEVSQFIQPPDESKFYIRYRDLRGESDVDDKVKQFVRADFQRPCNLQAGPLLQATLYQVEEKKWVFTYVIHHIACDGWSKNILIRELFQYYDHFTTGAGDIPSPLRIQYKDYAVWQRSQLSGELLDHHKQYWLRQFEGDIPVLDLPSNLTRPTLKTYNGYAFGQSMNVKHARRLKELSQTLGATLFMGMVALVDALFYRYTRHTDIVIGLPIIGRNHVDLESQIGLYANTLALHVMFNGNDSFKDLLSLVKRTAAGAYEHQIYPFDKLVSDLDLKRDMSRNPLFDVQVTVQNAKGSEVDDVQYLQRIKIREYNGAEKLTSVFDMVFEFIETEETFRLNLKYNSDIYDADTISGIAAHLVQLIESVVENPDLPIDELNILPPDEITKQLIEFNKATLVLPVDCDLVSLFERQAAKTPEARAVISENDGLTFEELDREANALANYLMTAYQIKAGSLVGVMMNRTEKFIIALLGILKAGAAYVPVDPEYPKTRKRYIVGESSIDLLITQTDYLYDLDAVTCNIFSIDVELYGNDISRPDYTSAIHRRDLAYVIYTSGSTGHPKGVMVAHATVVNTIMSLASIFELAEGDRHLQFSSSSFDASICEMFLSLLSGGTLCIIGEKEKKDPIRLGDWIADNQIDFAIIPPAYLRVLDIGKLKSLKKLVTAGEAAPLQKVNEFLKHGEYYNAYGPTETSICATVWKARRGETIDFRNVSIGYPIHNVQVYITDPHLRLLPIGAIGEICVGGHGIAKGYLSKPELTADKFLNNPFKPDDRIYRTGDFGRWLSDGSIEFVGRQDDQIKVRGHRVELGEIEKALRDCSGIKDACVVPYFHLNEKELAAYIVSPELQNSRVIRSALEKVLPAYAIPAFFVQVKEIPLSVSGKVDRKRLSKPDDAAMPIGTEWVGPTNEIESKMVKLWQEILNKERIGIRDSFFELGGDSIKVLRLVAAVRSELNVDLQVGDFYKYKTIEAIGKHIGKSGEEISQRSSMSSKDRALVLGELEDLRHEIFSTGGALQSSNIEDVYPASDIEIGMIYESILNSELGIYHDQIVRRKVFPGFDIKYFYLAVNLLVDKHSILRTGFNLTDYRKPVQFVYRSVDISVGYKDISELSRHKQEAVLEDFLKEQIKKPFIITQAPLWRMDVYALGSDEIVLILQTHHAIIDGWSEASLLTELNNTYVELSKNTGFQTGKLKASYRDYIVQHLLDKNDNSLRSFWLQELTDFTKMDIFTVHTEFASYTSILEPADYDQLKRTASDFGASVKTLSFSAYLYLLKLLSADETVVAGLVSNMRPDCEDGDKILGCFLNTIPFKATLNGEKRGYYFVQEIHNKVISLKDYEKLSMLEISRIHGRDTEVGNPFFDVIFNFTDFHAYSALIEDVDMLETEAVLPSLDVNGQGRTNTFLDFSINVTGGSYAIKCRLARKLRSGVSAADVANLYRKILLHIIYNPTRPVNEVELLDEKEKHILLDKFCAPNLVEDEARSIIAVFEEQADKTPDNVAVVYQGKNYTFRDVNETANQFGYYIQERWKVNPQDLIAIKMERSEGMLIAILAIMKCGAAYLPIDPIYPEERICHITDDSQCKGCVDAKVWEDFIRHKDAYASGNMGFDPAPDHLAYVIYTSGSTGKPKGVMVENKALLNLCRWHVDNFSVSAVDRATLYASPAFDAAVWELFPYLISGAAVYMIPEDIRLEVEKLSAFFDENQISISFLPTQVAEQFFQIDNQSLRYLLVGGEKLNYVRKRNYVIVNNYGPTENAVVATSCMVDEGVVMVPIGKPIRNNRIYILGTHEELLPIGFVGEIYIGGSSLARGYLHNPELTTSYFVNNRYARGERMYRTGDLGRWLPDGNIEYVGRRDNQVKIRGNRVELGEIENTLLSYQGLESAVVITGPVGESENELIAYVISKADIKSPDLRNFLLARLPAYMVPHHFVWLDALPLTPNGKIDKRSLLSIAVNRVESEVEYVPPRNKSEMMLWDIWRDILGLDSIGVIDNFFKVGGHSMLALKVVTAVNRKLHVDLLIRDFFNHPTIEDLAKFIGEADHRTHGELIPLDLDKESSISVNSDELASLPGFSEIPKCVLLTGATGFVGVYLLKELLDQPDVTVYCLVRATSVVQGRSRIIRELMHYDLYSPEYDSRIIPVLGDLSKSHFAISSDEYDMLSTNVDLIYHSGAGMDLVSSYEQLRSVNVNSATYLVELAATRKRKKIIYVSTLSIFSGNRKDIYYESEPIDREVHSAASGYAASKWVGEKIMFRAKEIGMDIQVYRLGLVTGDSVTGKMPEGQWFSKLLKSCMEMSMYPRDFAVAMTPVDFIAKSILKLSFKKDFYGDIFHLVNSRHVSLGAFFRNGEQQGNDGIKPVSNADWLARLNAMALSSPVPITPLIISRTDMVPGKDNQDIQFFLSHRSSYSTTATFEALDEVDIRFPDERPYLEKYVQHILSLDHPASAVG